MAYISGMQTNTQLSLKIKGLYSEPLSDADAMAAGKRLVSFFKILADIDKQQKRKQNDNNGNKNTTDTAK